MILNITGALGPLSHFFTVALCAALPVNLDLIGEVMEKMNSLESVKEADLWLLFKYLLDLEVVSEECQVFLFIGKYM